MPDTPDVEQPFLSHLVELRDRLLRVVLVVLAIFVALFVFPGQNALYTYLAGPLMAHMPEGTSMIATEVASPFLTPMKLTFVTSVFLSIPFILYQLWAFVAPGLYQHERKMVYPLMVSSSLLFYTGMAFAYYVVFPLVFKFLTGTTPDGVAVMTDIGRYLDFVLTLFFAFGLAFEVPIATILLVWMGVTTPDSLAAKRPYIIVGAFVIGMVLTPPDIISQTLLALPMWVLFEIGVIFSRGFVREKDESEQDEDADDSGSGSDPDGDDEEENASTQRSTSEDFTPLTDDEMEAELERIEAQESMLDSDTGTGPLGAEEAGDEVSEKLRRAMELRYQGDLAAARTVLYEVLVEGTEQQIDAARHLLNELNH